VLDKNTKRVLVSLYFCDLCYLIELWIARIVMCYTSSCGENYIYYLLRI